MAQVKTTITIVDEASKKLDKINKSLQNLTKSFDKLSQQSRAFNTNLKNGAVQATNIANKLNGVNIQATAASKSVNNASKGVKNFSNSARDAEHATSVLITKLRRLASTYLGVMGLKYALNTSDTLTSAENRLGNLAYKQGISDKSGRMQFSDATLDKIYVSAQRAATGYHDMASNVSKTLTLAGSSFGDDFAQQVDNAIVFQEIMAKSYALGGASAAEQASSMYQLTQALGAGVLAGDELRSVREGAPLAYQAIEKFAQGLLHCSDSLKDMASDGLITSEIVVAAILDMEQATDDAFKNIDLTFAQMWTIFKNDTQKAFEPFLRTLREIANSDAIEKMMGDVTKLMQVLGTVFNWVAQAVQSLVDFMAANWETVKTIFMMLAGVIGGIVVGTLMDAVKRTTEVISLFVTGHATIIMLVAGITALVYMIYKFAQASGDVAEAIGKALFYIAAVLVAVAVVASAAGLEMAFGLSLPMLLWIALIVAVLAAFFKFTEEVCGAVAWLGATLWNIVVGLVNAIFQLLCTLFEPILTIVDFIYNAFNGGFEGIFGAFKNWFGQMLSYLMSFAKIATKIIDAIFGTSWTNKISEWQSEVQSWGTNENYVSFKTELEDPLKRISAKDAYATGANFGANLHDKMNGWFSGIGGNAFNFDDYSGIGAVSSAPNYEELLKGIEGNTGKTAKNTELSEEDLKYLRLLAEQGVINKFTTAEIKVEMVNQNNISKDTDMDAVMAHFKTVLEEELSVVAAGVHV